VIVRRPQVGDTRSPFDLFVGADEILPVPQRLDCEERRRTAPPTSHQKNLVQPDSVAPGDEVKSGRISPSTARGMVTARNALPPASL